MEKISKITKRLHYRYLLTAIIPVVLFSWAGFTGNIVSLPVPDSLTFGFLPLALGLIFVSSGLWKLSGLGIGLSNRIFPEIKFMKDGIYSFTRHPVYSGFIMICFGLSAISRSSSGFWLVSPLLTLMIVAIVEGFKNDKTRSFSGFRDSKPFLSLPDASDILPSFSDRISSCLLVFIPWLLIYETFIFIGAPKDAMITNLPFERDLPVWEFSEVFYVSAFLFSLSVLFVIKSKKQLRFFITDVWVTIIIVGIIYMVFPLIVKQRTFVPHSFLGRLLLYERTTDGESGALPSCHVIWAFLSAAYFSRSSVRLKWLWYAFAALISASCITTGNHTFPDVIAGFCTFIVILYRKNIWNYILHKTDSLSNSPREWEIGRLTIMNQGFYSGAAGFVGVMLAGFFTGREHTPDLFFILVLILSGTCLLSVISKGCREMLRYYGYYAVLIAGILTCALASFLFSFDFFILPGAFAMAAPWTHAILRLRYLVQGHYYGKNSEAIYSIFKDILTGLVLISLFNAGMTASFIFGVYLILNETARLAEKAFRAAGQTPLWQRTKIYQWTSILFFLTGIIFTAMPCKTILTFHPGILSIICATVVSILVFMVSGIDFRPPNKHNVYREIK